jgi:hypothetical protein
VPGMWWRARPISCASKIGTLPTDQGKKVEGRIENEKLARLNQNKSFTKSARVRINALSI